MVNEILDYSRLKYRDIELDMGPVDINSIAQLIISITRPLADKKSLELVNSVSPGLPKVMGDGNRVQQILFNLVGNAIKFTGKGRVAIDAEVKSGMIVVSVSDTGPGIPAESFSRIFESFEQGDGSVSRKYGGTGLGLSISRKLVELHGGTMWVESVPDTGSTFFFTLNICDRREKRPDVISEGVTAGNDCDDFSGLIHSPGDYGAVRFLRKEEVPGKARVLVVDDEPVNLQVMINFLAMEGYEIDIAPSGEKALSLIASGKAYDLVLLDVMMPVMSGYDVCREIRRGFTPYELPVLMLTARKSTLDRVTGFEVGAKDYITKPYDKQELLSRAGNLVGLKRSVHDHKKLSAIEHELSIAREIQKNILPRETPSIKGLDIRVNYSSLYEVGGDFYDFNTINGSRCGIFIADVSGHGIPAAIISSMLKVAFVLNRDKSDSPVAIISSINGALFSNTYGLFITANYTVIDLAKKKMVSCNAGHWPVILYRKSTDEVFEIRARGVFMGLLKESKYSEVETPLLPGDRIIFYTDGIIEQRNQDQVMFGEDNFMAAIRECRDISAGEFIDRTFDKLDKWATVKGSPLYEDDITMVVVDVT